MSVLDGPGEGTWSVFAMKVVEQREELLHKLAGQAAHIKSLEGLLVDALRERDAARAEVERLRALLPPSAHTGVRNGPGEGSWAVFAEKVVAERDEARADFANACDVGRRQEARAEKAERERDEARRDLGEILAVIHRDGGHHTGEHGVSQSVADAHATWASVVRERDEARAEVERLRAECDKASAMERHRIAEWMMRQAAIEASHGGLHGAVARSVLVALANAVLSGEHAE